MDGILDRSSTLLISTNNESVRTKLNRIDTEINQKIKSGWFFCCLKTITKTRVYMWVCKMNLIALIVHWTEQVFYYKSYYDKAYGKYENSIKMKKQLTFANDCFIITLE